MQIQSQEELAIWVMAMAARIENHEDDDFSDFWKVKAKNCLILMKQSSATSEQFKV